MAHRRTYTYSEAKFIAIKILDKAKSKKGYSIKQFCVDIDVPYQSVLAIRSGDQPVELPKVVEKILVSEFSVEVIPLTLYTINADEDSGEVADLLKTDRYE